LLLLDSLLQENVQHEDYPSVTIMSAKMRIRESESSEEKHTAKASEL